MEDQEKGLFIVCTHRCRPPNKHNSRFFSFGFQIRCQSGFYTIFNTSTKVRKLKGIHTHNVYFLCKFQFLFIIEKKNIKLIPCPSILCTQECIVPVYIVHMILVFDLSKKISNWSGLPTCVLHSFS